MAIQTDPTLSGLQAYASVIYSDNYMGFARLHATSWESTIESTKEKALVWASRLLNNLTYRGNKVDASQSLDWPRSYVLKAPGSSEVYSNDELPSILMDATCELALSLLEKDRTLNDEENLGLKELSVGSISMVFDHVEKADSFPTSVRDMLRPITLSGLVMRA